MFNSTDFYQLSYQQQADVLLSDATFLLSRIEESLIVDLYELDHLLVEVFYQKENEDLVSVMAYNSSEKLRALTNGANLKPRLTFKQDGSSYSARTGFYA